MGVGSSIGSLCIADELQPARKSRLLDASKSVRQCSHGGDTARARSRNSAWSCCRWAPFRASRLALVLLLRCCHPFQRPTVETDCPAEPCESSCLSRDSAQRLTQCLKWCLKRYSALSIQALSKAICASMAAALCAPDFVPETWHRSPRGRHGRQSVDDQSKDCQPLDRSKSRASRVWLV